MTKHAAEPRVKLVTYLSRAGKARLEEIAAAERIPVGELVRRYISAGILTHDAHAHDTRLSVLTERPEREQHEAPV